MSRASRARAITRAAALGGGGLVGAGGAFYGLLVGQAKFARRRIGEPTRVPPVADGRYGHWGGPPVRYAMLGDSAAAGYGVDHPEETTGAVVAAGLAELLQQPVEYRGFAVIGAKTSDLDPQVDAALAFGADVVTVVVGANDVTHQVTPGASVRLLQVAVRRLRDAGAEVVVGTCPDLGTIRPIPHPLRWVARTWSRSLAAAQIVGVVEAGGRSVSLADLLGEELELHGDVMFGPDRFHPSSLGYRAVAEAMIPSVAAALGHEEATEAVLVPATGVTSSIEHAAAQASETAGSEVARATPEEAGPHRAGIWARRLIRRQRSAPDPAESLEESSDQQPDPDQPIGDGGEQLSDR